MRKHTARAACCTVFLHPDCDRRPRHSTGSADLASSGGERSRACTALLTRTPRLPPVGTCTPPWRRFVS